MSFISAMEMIGTVAFAVSGALVAIDKKLDYYGIVILAITTAVGGGIVRDVIIDVELPVALADPIYVIISIGSAAVVIAFYKWMTRIQYLINIFDAVGLAAFTAIGALAAVNHDVYTPFVVLTLALLTGTGGGTLRDICVKEVPFVFRKEIYAVASLAGGIAFLIADVYLNLTMTMYICFGVTLVIRLVSMRFKLQLMRVDTGDVPDEEKIKERQIG